MIRAVLFDLGLTLIDERNRPFPHVTEALRTIQLFTTAKGKPLAFGPSSIDTSLFSTRQACGRSSSRFNAA